MEDGSTEGLLPSEISRALWEDLGHQPQPLLRAIRAKCLDCSHTATEVAKCTATLCSLWPYRMGTNPLREETEAQKAGRRVGIEKMKAMRPAK